MVLILRFIGVVNAAVWFGGALFFTMAIAPAFFAPEIKSILGDVYSGVIAQLVLERYFHLFYWAGGVALLHLAAEWLYLGRAVQRFTLGLLLATVSLGLLGGVWFQPKLRNLHQVNYGRDELYTPAQKDRAARALSLWYGASQAVNILSLAGLGLYFWRVVIAPDAPRFVPAAKFRS